MIDFLEHFIYPFISILALLILITVFLAEHIMRRKERVTDSLIFVGIAYISQPLFDFQSIALSWIQNQLNLPIQQINMSTQFCILWGIILIILGLLIKKGESSKQEKIPVLNMLGIHYQVRVNQNNCDKDLSKNFFEEKVIDFVDFFDKSGQISKNDNDRICKLIQKECSSFTAMTTNNELAYFTGMFPIPYEVYAGTFLNGSKTNEFLEFDSKTTKKLYKLSPVNKHKFFSSNPLQINKTENIKGGPDLNLIIQVTSKINFQDLEQFQNFSSAAIGLYEYKDNLIRNKEHLYELKNTISSMMENYGKQDFSRIHITAAIPSCLALELGKEIAQMGNRLPEIVIYHYVRTNEKRYPFGLIVNGNKKGELYHV